LTEPVRRERHGAKRGRLAWPAAIAALAACGAPTAGPDAAPEALVTPECAAATTYSNLASIEQEIFPRCAAAGCHNGSGTSAGRLDFRAGKAHASLVGVVSNLEPARRLVVAGDRAASYLLVMLGQVAPGDASPPATEPVTGFMPSNNGGRLLCVEQREAIERWITMGSANN
jgi:hypothetical protein